MTQHHNDATDNRRPDDTTLLIHNIRLAGQAEASAWLLVRGDKIDAIGNGADMPDADTTYDGAGALAMPGAIDCHVHYREPGLTAKADIASESHAAIAGGVASYLEMPNTVPQTTTVELWQQKMDIAAARSAGNYAFFIGATNDNLDELRRADYSRVPGVKLFMGSSTGNMLVDDDDAIARIFRDIDAIIAVHAEDQTIIARYTKMFEDLRDENGDLPIEFHSHIRAISACHSATSRAVAMAKKYDRRLHICHLTTEVELGLLQQGDPATKLITSEVSPHHLMWCMDDYKTRGALIKMNPAVKEAADRDALRQALIDGRIDIVATDHAPHQLSEKSGGALRAVSGAPLVQFSLPWMLTNFDECLVQRVMCENPAKVYHIDRRGSLSPGNYADITLVDKVEPYAISDADVVSKCGWTPMRGVPLSYRVRKVWVNGTYGHAMPLRFNRS